MHHSPGDSLFEKEKIMKSRKCPLLAVILIAVATFLSGCIALPIPHTTKQSPGLDGRVVDLEGRPVKGARIEVEVHECYSRSEYDSTIGARTRTGSDGRFSLWPRYNFHFIWYANPSFQLHLPGGSSWTGRVAIRHDSFNYLMIYGTVATNGHVGDLHLIPATSTPLP
jgi:hypothetical protein